MSVEHWYRAVVFVTRQGLEQVIASRAQQHRHSLIHYYARSASGGHLEEVELPEVSSGAAQGDSTLEESFRQRLQEIGGLERVHAVELDPRAMEAYKHQCVQAFAASKYSQAKQVVLRLRHLESRASATEPPKSFLYLVDHALTFIQFGGVLDDGKSEAASIADETERLLLNQAESGDVAQERVDSVNPTSSLKLGAFAALGILLTVIMAFTTNFLIWTSVSASTRYSVSKDFAVAFLTTVDAHVDAYRTNALQAIELGVNPELFFSNSSQDMTRLVIEMKRAVLSHEIPSIQACDPNTGKYLGVFLNDSSYFFHRSLESGMPLELGSDREINSMQLRVVVDVFDAKSLVWCTLNATSDWSAFGHTSHFSSGVAVQSLQRDHSSPIAVAVEFSLMDFSRFSFTSSFFVLEQSENFSPISSCSSGSSYSTLCKELIDALNVSRVTANDLIGGYVFEEGALEHFVAASVPLFQDLICVYVVGAHEYLDPIAGERIAGIVLITFSIVLCSVLLMLSLCIFYPGILNSMKCSNHEIDSRSPFHYMIVVIVVMFFCGFVPWSIQSRVLEQQTLEMITSTVRIQSTASFIHASELVSRHDHLIHFVEGALKDHNATSVSDLEAIAHELSEAMNEVPEIEGVVLVDLASRSFSRLRRRDNQWVFGLSNQLNGYCYEEIVVTSLGLNFSQVSFLSSTCNYSVFSRSNRRGLFLSFGEVLDNLTDSDSPILSDLVYLENSYIPNYLLQKKVLDSTLLIASELPFNQISLAFNCDVPVERLIVLDPQGFVVNEPVPASQIPGLVSFPISRNALNQSDQNHLSYLEQDECLDFCRLNVPIDEDLLFAAQIPELPRWVLAIRLEKDDYFQRFEERRTLSFLLAVAALIVSQTVIRALTISVHLLSFEVLS